MDCKALAEPPFGSTQGRQYSKVGAARPGSRALQNRETEKKPHPKNRYCEVTILFRDWKRDARCRMMEDKRCLVRD